MQPLLTWTFELTQTYLIDGRPQHYDYIVLAPLSAMRDVNHLYYYNSLMDVAACMEQPFPILRKEGGRRYRIVTLYSSDSFIVSVRA